VVLAAVRGDGSWSALQYVSDELRADREVVLAAVIDDCSGYVLQNASDELQADREGMLAAVSGDVSPTVRELCQGRPRSGSPDTRGSYAADRRFGG
jgi:hypothetical protein